MQSIKNIQHFEALHVKNEVITIEEDEIQSTKIDEAQQLGAHDNGGSSNLIYYFEPQQKTNYIVNTEPKSEFTISIIFFP